MTTTPVLAVDAARSRLARLDPRDAPLLQFWRELAPQDFDADDPRAVISLDFEMSGIDRGIQSLARTASIAPVAGRSVLDIGSGNGGLCIACAASGAAHVAGLEIEPMRITLASRWADCRGVHVDFHQGVAERLPFADASFDVVFLSSVIEHVQDQKQTVREMARVLRPGGHFFVDGPNRLSPHWLREDPHYRMMGISVLPPRLGRWWVVDMRKVSPTYDVGVFPIYSRLVRLLSRHGLQLVQSEFHNYALSVLTDPNRVHSRPKRALLQLTRAVGVNSALASLLRNTLPSFSIVGRKVLRQGNLGWRAGCGVPEPPEASERQ